GPAAGTSSPRGVAVCYVPTGVLPSAWTPATMGHDYMLTPTLKPLLEFREDLLVLSGLTCDKARPNGDGPGDHARAMAAFLTCRQPRKTQGADIRAGVSVDQLYTQHHGNRTRFPSLEIGCEAGRQAGGFDSGYTSSHTPHPSLRKRNHPAAHGNNPPRRLRPAVRQRAPRRGRRQPPPPRALQPERPGFRSGRRQPAQRPPGRQRPAPHGRVPDLPPRG